MKAGVLALQGDFREHATVLADLGAAPIEVRNPDELGRVEALVIPGGESTTISKLARTAGLVGPVPARATGAALRGGPGPSGAGDPPLPLVDITVRRNAYGRQVDSFEADLAVDGVDHPVRAVFIRAPMVEDGGEGG